MITRLKPFAIATTLVVVCVSFGSLARPAAHWAFEFSRSTDPNHRRNNDFLRSTGSSGVLPDDPVGRQSQRSFFSDFARWPFVADKDKKTVTEIKLTGRTDRARACELQTPVGE